jgi:hypothetical protein
MTSNWGVLGLFGKVRRYPFKWNYFHVQIHPESVGVIKIIGHLESVLVLHRRFWRLGHVSYLGPLGLHPGGSSMSLDPLLSVSTTKLVLGFCLD